ncbi:hypothetical protein KC953_02690, partial [Candidatus Saccharibacteria bacterium]|nr:hypothetical protein [Candidatus Saccharibacteria bacterium]
DLQREIDGGDVQERDELIRLSARNHLQSLAAFYKRLYPESNAVHVEDGVHSALPLRNVINGDNIMFLATTLILDEGRSVDLISVSSRDEYVLSNSSVFMNDDGRFETVGMIKARDDGLIDEALRLVEVGKRNLVLPLLSGVVHPNDVASRLNELRKVVAESYDDDATERFISNVENCYHEKRQTAQMAKELGLVEMSLSEIEDVLSRLASIEDYQ